MGVVFRGRSSLLWLLAPALVFLVPLPWVNHPYVLGPWLFGSVLLTPVFVRLAARRDPLFGEEVSGDVDRDGDRDGDGGDGGDR